MWGNTLCDNTARQGDTDSICAAPLGREDGGRLGGVGPIIASVSVVVIVTGADARRAGVSSAAPAS